MDFISELKWRGMLHDMTPGLEELLAKGGIYARLYRMGFADPA